MFNSNIKFIVIVSKLGQHKNIRISQSDAGKVVSLQKSGVTCNNRTHTHSDLADSPTLNQNISRLSDDAGLAES